MTNWNVQTTVENCRSVLWRDVFAQAYEKHGGNPHRAADDADVALNRHCVRFVGGDEVKNPPEKK